MTKTISLEEVFELEARKKEINSLNLKDIVWIKQDGKEHGFSPKDIDNWAFTGLTNIDFIMNYFTGTM